MRYPGDRFGQKLGTLHRSKIPLKNQDARVFFLSHTWDAVLQVATNTCIFPSNETHLFSMCLLLANHGTLHSYIEPLASTHLHPPLHLQVCPPTSTFTGLSTHLYIYRSVHPPLRLQVCPPTSTFTGLSTHLYIYRSVHPPLHLQVCPPTSTFTGLSTHLYIYRSVHPPLHLQVCASTSTFTGLSTNLYIYRSVHPPLHLQVCPPTSTFTGLSSHLYIYRSVHPPLHLQVCPPTSTFTALWHKAKGQPVVVPHCPVICSVVLCSNYKKYPPTHTHIIVREFNLLLIIHWKYVHVAWL